MKKNMEMNLMKRKELMKNNNYRISKNDKKTIN